ncbi:MAG: hypothetical protein EOO90_03770 [Pedobacter sp.]|nr:MAG: hypothetical protein EOO90_03770 [Pedobacter sp.]
MKRCFLLILIALKLTDVRGQGVFDLKRMRATSPEAAMQAPFGDIPIGHYTGTANISVPLYNLSKAGLDIPIVLRYLCKRKWQTHRGDNR